MAGSEYKCVICGQPVSKRKSYAYGDGRACKTHQEAQASNEEKAHAEREAFRLDRSGSSRLGHGGRGGAKHRNQAGGCRNDGTVPVPEMHDGASYLCVRRTLLVRLSKHSARRSRYILSVRVGMLLDGFCRVHRGGLSNVSSFTISG